MARLARELQFASPAAARRHLQRLEALALELLSPPSDDPPPAAYQAPWVVHRITGLRPSSRSDDDSAASLVREALLADLNALAQRLSQRANFSAADCPSPDWLTPAELEARWSCSRKAIERAQHRGLPSRRVLASGGVERIVFSLPFVMAFERAHHLSTGDSQGTERPRRHISAEEQAELIRRSRVYQSRLNFTLDQAATRLARRFSRTRQGVRRVLLQADPPLATSLPGTRTSPQPPHRARRLARLNALLAVDLSAPSPAGDPPKPLAPRDLAALTPPQPMVVGAVLAYALRPKELTPARERDLARWYCHLMAGARHGLSNINRLHPGSDALDRIETTLRLAGRIKARLIIDELALVVRSIESLLGEPALAVNVRTLFALCRTGIDALVESFAQYDPYKGGRLAAPATIAVNRALTSASRALAEKAALDTRPKAIARSASVDIESVVWSGVAAPWQPFLEPPPSALARIDTLAPQFRALFIARFGLTSAGDPPRTLKDLAEFLGRPLVRVAADERATRIALGWPP